jgi:hypothetical protein
MNLGALIVTERREEGRETRDREDNLRDEGGRKRESLRGEEDLTKGMRLR